MQIADDERCVFNVQCSSLLHLIIAFCDVYINAMNMKSGRSTVFLHFEHKGFNKTSTHSHDRIQMQRQMQNRCIDEREHRKVIEFTRVHLIFALCYSLMNECVFIDWVFCDAYISVHQNHAT